MISTSPLPEDLSDANNGNGNAVRRVMANQMLFQAGNSLTTGSFFNYFAASFHPSAFWMALLMIVPETCQALSILGRPLTLWLGLRKRVWWTGLILARGTALLIPLALWLPVGSGVVPIPLQFLLCCVIVWYLAQGMSFVNYLSWISDLVPPRRWGFLLSRRQWASLLVGILFPLGALVLRRQILSRLPVQSAQWSYAALFWCGGVICLLSLLPLWKLPDLPLPKIAAANVASWKSVLTNRLFQRLLAARWTAAFFQGLTQSVLFKFSVDVLKISLETSMCLVSLMLILQLPICWVAGRLCDAQRDRSGLIAGLLLVSLAMPCWLLATPLNWGWLIVAYMLWGAFGLVNVCGMSLCFKLSPRGDNLRGIALYEQVSGLIAGGAGLLGGWWLDHSLTQSGTDAAQRLSAFHMIMIVSWIGRMLAPVWLLRLTRPAPKIT